MPNTYFQFKQFTINQDRSVMKVCTDSCLFGALVQVKENARVLDIGTGTGLLSLMISQKNNVMIDAIEIDNNTSIQARENIKNSPWVDQINVYHTSFQKYRNSSPRKYDLIVCNPPFYKNQYPSGNHGKLISMHNDLLSGEDLVAGTNELLNPDGKFYIMYPPQQAVVFTKLAIDTGLYLIKRVKLMDNPKARVLRNILIFGKNPVKMKDEDLYIKDENGNYTQQFKDLLSPYYLNL